MQLLLFANAFKLVNYSSFLPSIAFLCSGIYFLYFHKISLLVAVYVLTWPIYLSKTASYRPTSHLYSIQAVPLVTTNITHRHAFTTKVIEGWIIWLIKVTLYIFACWPPSLQSLPYISLLVFLPPYINHRPSTLREAAKQMNNTARDYEAAKQRKRNKVAEQRNKVAEQRNKVAEQRNKVAEQRNSKKRKNGGSAK